MDIFLVDINAAIVDQWNLAIEDAGLTNVEAIHAPFSDIKADALVSPANSFAIMDGGVDTVIREWFGVKAETDIRDSVIAKYGMPILPVGCAVAVNANESWTGYKYLISAPTMNTPTIIRKTINGYLATRAALICAKEIGCESVVLTGMGGLTGGYGPQACAKQMIRAIIDYPYPKNAKCSQWEAVQHLYQELGCSL